MTRTPSREKAKQLVWYLRDEQPDYAYLKSIFRHLREHLNITKNNSHMQTIFRCPDIENLH